MAILKRLNYRNANVQLYALALAEALTKNCGVELHREIASRSFTQGLEKIVMDRVNLPYVVDIRSLTSKSPQEHARQGETTGPRAYPNVGP